MPIDRAILKGLVDEGLSNPAELVYLAGQLNGVNTGAADFRSVPTTTDAIYVNGQSLSIVRAIEPSASDLYEALREGKPLGDLGMGQTIEKGQRHALALRRAQLLHALASRPGLPLQRVCRGSGSGTTLGGTVRRTRHQPRHPTNPQGYPASRLGA